ncbi:MAG: phosphoribosylanthranilate isomerase [Cocleimonas sp.]
MNSASHIRVKICGITSIEDADNACTAGADAIGLVFYEKSPRNISINKAREICNSLPPFITSVGLFLDAPSEFVNSVLATVPLDLLQFHGSETAEYCASFSHPYIKAVGMKGMKSAEDFVQYTNQFSEAKGFLIDSHAKGKAGGTGETFNWSKIPQNINKPIILAGGLNPDNISDAIKQTSVYAFDLSSGVERQPGIKDKQKIIQLFMNIQKTEVTRAK